ncbi:P-loop NTPase fold protein [Pseudomonas mediterranea]|uniref:KAP family P-loop NTPase fold protein n=1 Tax=Pseudomonas mediterranea TaxID=183795 RepID=UPI00191E2786|nr:P-loop NTPase fold protein [Pseudomonas mediterranea]MBL0844082.1 NTPase [Pseudomonas mediterranea]UZE00972.1 KAP family NTPase [Pseudomonas mediterranea]
MEDLRFADDRPIARYEQDLLRRSGFARNLAAAMTNWRDQESLVIALMGPWGSGKSSIKNLVVEDFKSVPGYEVIEFNPWEWAGQEKLSATFFDEVSLAIQRKDKSKEGKRLAKALRQYGRRVNASAIVIDGMAKYLPLFLGSALVASYISSWVSSLMAQTILHYVSGFSAIAAVPALLKKVAKFLQDSADSADKAAKDDELTLSEIRSEITLLLAKRSHPLLIVMDDIDRLASDQMKALFQLVKGNMQFPNVVFLLLFQRDVVENGLQRAGFNGAEYLEKIIQVPFSVPNLPASSLETVLIQRLDTILATEPQLAANFDLNYWAGVYRQGMKSYFKNLRDVYRYTSTLTFHCRLLRGGDVAEINAVDLFALEGLRVFAPSSYEAIAQSKELLTDSLSSHTQAEKERIAGLIQRMVELAPQAYRVGTEQTLKLLFPNLDWVFKNTTHSGSTRMRWVRESRVCCNDFFDRYFELWISDEEVSNSLLHFLVRQLTNAQRFCEQLRDYDETRQKAILDRLESRIEEFPLDQSEAVVETLLKAGETVSRGESSTASLSAPAQIFRLLLFFLRRHHEPTERSKLLLCAFEQVKGFAVLEYLLMSESSAREKSDITDLDDVGFETLKQAFIEALLVHANQDPDAFLAHWSFVSYAYRLNRFADGAGKKWANQHVTTIERFLLLARSVVSKGTAYGGEVASNFYFVRIATLDDLFGVEACKSWLAQVDRIVLTGLEKQAIELVDDAMGRYSRGEKSDFD